jgi:hypothetical protein
MSLSANQVTITSFDTEVKRTYQKGGMLRPTVRHKKNVKGSEHKFYKYGKGIATENVRGNDVQPMNATQKPIACVLKDWDCFEYVYQVDINKMAYDEKVEASASISAGMGRREDQEVITALGATPNVLNHSTVKLSTAIFGKTRTFMANKAVPSSDRTFVCSPYQVADMLDDEKATSSDYTNIQALVKGDLKTFYGFNIVEIEERTEGGLPFKATGTVRTCYAYHKHSVGLATGAVKTGIDWVATKQAYQIGQVHAIGATIIDEDGVVAVKVKETV